MKRIIVLAAFALALSANSKTMAAPTATLSWTAPATNTDGSIISGTITYNVYQGAQGSTLTKVQSALAAAAASVTSGLTAGATQCFAVTAVVNGVESAQSVTACAAVPFPTPGVPSQITVVIH